MGSSERGDLRSARRPSLSELSGSKSAAYLLLGVRVAVVVIVVVVAHRRAITDDDIARFQQIAEARGTPYRDYSVEYMPVELAIIKVAAVGDVAGTAERVALIAFAADLAAWAILRRGWGAPAGLVYLLLGTPLLAFIYLRLDLVVVAIAVGALWLLRRGRDGASGAVLAAGVVAKVWPIVLVPAFVVQRRWRALLWFGAVLGASTVVWLAVSGTEGPQDVVTFRGASGWHIESTIGTIVWIATGGPLRQESGATRVGQIPAGAIAALVGVGVVGVYASWRPRTRGERLSAGRSSLSAVGTLLVISPLFSLQYAAWLLPWGAIAAVEDGERAARAVFAIGSITGVLSIVYRTPGSSGSGLAQALLVVRALCCAFVVVDRFAGRPTVEEA